MLPIRPILTPNHSPTLLECYISYPEVSECTVGLTYTLHLLFSFDWTRKWCHIQFQANTQLSDPLYLSPTSKNSLLNCLVNSVASQASKRNKFPFFHQVILVNGTIGLSSSQGIRTTSKVQVQLILDPWWVKNRSTHFSCSCSILTFEFHTPL